MVALFSGRSHRIKGRMTLSLPKSRYNLESVESHDLENGLAQGAETSKLGGNSVGPSWIFGECES